MRYRVEYRAALIAALVVTWSAAPPHPADAGTAAAISTSEATTCVVRSDGTVWCWGANQYGQLGNGTTSVYIVGNAGDVAGGGGTSCASKTDGTAWCWGWNAYGQVGDGTTRDRKSAVRVKTSKQTLLPANVIDMVGGYHYNCARRSDTSVWCWGSAQLFAQPVLKGGSSFLGTVQLAAQIMHVCARKADGTVWCWGDNSLGELGNGSGLSSDEPVQVLIAPGGPPLADAIDLSRGSYAFYTCIRRQDMSPWCWGDNEYGQLGDGTFTMRPNPVEATVFPSF